MAKYGVKEVADVTLYDLTTNKAILYLDSLKVSSIENTADVSDARGGKGNPKILSWNFNRAARVTMQDAVMNPISIQLLTGNSLSTGATSLYKREVLTTVAGTTGGNSKVTLSKAPLSGAGNPITVFKLSDEVTEVPTISVTGSVIEFTIASAAVGIQVVVYYKYNSDVTAQTMTITSDKFPPFVRLVGDTVIRNTATGADEAFQFIINKAKIEPNFNLTFQADGDPTVFDMNLEVYRGDTSTEMIQLIKY